ncbi:MAG: deoxyribose-phosphate aldolase [Prevotellaceae bacterium]|jgi:deoxyribose-phosphate aldolase|nr:deoxyribose-phosphate aldolase [Prevotellaceae bacterium]
MKDFKQLFSQYQLPVSDETVKQQVEKILAEKSAGNNNVEVYKKLFSCIDLTSLNHTDHAEQIAGFTKKANELQKYYAEMPNVAALCVYPSLVETVKTHLSEFAEMGIAAVSAGFPSSQTFIEVKVAETALAVMSGATEIDVVISVGKFLAGDYQAVLEELEEIKASCRHAHLKVILESGSLGSAQNIFKASLIAMLAGADFIKTSTGKTSPAATLEAALVMCQAIRQFHEKTGVKVGFKPAGGIATTQDAVNYYTIVKEVLGNDWLNNKLFRLGASRLANSLLTDIYGKEEKYF